MERVTSTYARRPIQKFDTVVVPAREAWPEYEAYGAYICQPGRTFRTVDRFAFYEGRSIKIDVPFVTGRADNVEWSVAEQTRLLASDSSATQKLGQLISDTLNLSRAPGRYQVFWLTKARDARHRKLTAEIPHTARGRGSAFTQRQRYVSLHALETATSTDDL